MTEDIVFEPDLDLEWEVGSEREIVFDPDGVEDEAAAA